jgi:hypothetical protein
LDFILVNRLRICSKMPVYKGQGLPACNGEAQWVYNTTWMCSMSA